MVHSNTIMYVFIYKLINVFLQGKSSSPLKGFISIDVNAQLS